MIPALLSDCHAYRYWLFRGRPGSRVCFVMLNPSTADATEDDPTVRRCRGFSEAWGFDGFQVLNLYAYRATDPKQLAAVPDPHGPDNHGWLRHWLPRADLVVCAWGTHADPRTVGRFVELAGSLGVPLFCLDTTKDGHPSHPLYLKGDLKPRPWK